MHIRRKGIGGLATLGALALLTAPVALAAPPLPAPEPSFMGIRLLSSFRDVLKKYGQPQEIQVGSPYIPGTGAPPAATAGGVATGGLGRGPMAGGPMMGGPMMGMGMPPGMSAPGSGGSPFSGGRGLPGFPGSAMGRRGEDDGGSPFGPGGPGSAGRPSGGASPYGGLPGFSGGPGSVGGMSGGPMAAGTSGGAGIPGFAGGAAGSAQQEEPAGETTWWYYDKKKGVYRSFLFNKEGKVIQISLYGYKGGNRTRRGIGLGSSLGQVIRQYRWSNDGYRVGDNMLLKYGGRQQLAFQLSKNQVVGITLAYVR